VRRDVSREKKVGVKRGTLSFVLALKSERKDELERLSAKEERQEKRER